MHDKPINNLPPNQAPEMTPEQAQRLNRWQCRRRRFALVLAGSFVLFVILGLLATEFYLRYKACYVIQNNIGTGRGFLVENDPGFLVRYTANGRRLIANANVTVRNHGISGRDVRLKINSMGFRDTEITPEKPDGECRILVLGDSITCGTYLPVEQVYVERMQTYLNNGRDTPRIEVINAGVEDIGLKEEIDILTESGLKLQPDLVMVAFYLNDSRPPWGFPGELGRASWLRRNSILAEMVYRRYKLARWLKQKGHSRFVWRKYKDKLDWRHNPQAFAEFVRLARHDWGAAWNPDSWGSLEPQFDRLKRLASRHKFRVVFVAFPVAYQVYADKLDDYPQRVLKETCEAYAFDYYDLLPVLRDTKDPNLFFDNCHPREKTNDLVGRTVAAWFEAQKLVPVRQKQTDKQQFGTVNTQSSDSR